jgi:uncharacterized protein involved in exopolysaccharide biosynthesis
MSVLRFIVGLLLVAVIAAAVGVAALVLSRAQPVEYAAVMKLSFSAETRPELQVLGAPFVRPGGDVDVFTATNAQLVGSREVADRVARDRRPKLGLTGDEVANRVSVTGLTGTEIVQLQATGPTPRAATELASAYGSSFLSWFRDRQRRRARDVEQVLRDRYADLTRAQRRTATGASIRGQLSALDVLASVGSGSPEVIEGAHASGSPQQPKTRRNVIFAVIFGLALGVGLVALRAELRRRQLPPP